MFRMARAVMDLPQPLSPMTPNVLPRWMVRVSPSTALTIPARTSNSTRRSLTSIKGSFCSFMGVSILTGTVRVEGIPQAIAEHIVGQDRDKNKWHSPQFPGGVMDGAHTGSVL